MTGGRKNVKNQELFGKSLDSLFIFFKKIIKYQPAIPVVYFFVNFQTTNTSFSGYW